MPVQSVASKGTNSPECAVAWDEVEELHAEAAHQKAEVTQQKKTPFEEYCEENPGRFRSKNLRFLTRFIAAVDRDSQSTQDQARSRQDAAELFNSREGAKE